MRFDQKFRFVSAMGETIFAIPFLGGYFIFRTFWIPLCIMLILHILTFVYSSKVKFIHKTGSIFGIFASVLGAIPFVGWSLHVLAATVLWVNFALAE